jgi:hypothetical protein
MRKKLIGGLLLLIVICAFTKKDELTGLQFLEGTWKTENKENYESWKKTEDGSFEGHSYKMKEQKKMITEYLVIRAAGDKVTYTATVLGQNGSKPIDFVLNRDIKDKFSFENPSHDFPKKIQYTPISRTVLLVQVLGDGDKGFSYKMIKQNK